MVLAVEKSPVRYFNFELADGRTVRIRADTICQPTKAGELHYTLKHDGEEVGRFKKTSIIGWWVEEVTTPMLAS